MIGYLNLVTLVASIPIIGAGLWLAHGSAAVTCESALQTPLLAIGFIVLLISLAGFIGACYHVTWALWLYLLAMLLLVLALLGITVFGLAVTAAGGGGGRQVPGRPYREFRITDYSAWLQRHVEVDRYWRAALACVVGSRACPRIAAWTPLDYLQHNLTPIQVGNYEYARVFFFLLLIKLQCKNARSLDAASHRHHAHTTSKAYPLLRRRKTRRTATGGTMPPASCATSATRAKPECWSRCAETGTPSPSSMSSSLFYS